MTNSNNNSKKRPKAKTQAERREDVAPTKNYLGQWELDVVLTHYNLGAWALSRIVEKVDEETGEKTIVYKPFKYPGTLRQAVRALKMHYIPQKHFSDADEIIECLDYVENRILQHLDQLIIERERKNG